MDPNAPLTTQPFTQAIGAIALGVAAPWLIILPAWWAWERYQDRTASREAQERLRRWEATPPLEPEDEWARLAQIKDRLWLESLSPDAPAAPGRGRARGAGARHPGSRAAGGPQR